MSTLLCKSPAKINLFLQIVGRRDDGYHDIQTLFQTIDLCDQLRFERTDTPGASLTCVGPYGKNIPSDASNLVLRAWQRVAEAAEATGLVVDSGVKITLEKNIPSEAGLGGGSSNAATTLDAARAMLEVELSDEQMQQIATDLGADVPFFLSGQACAIGTGIGEKLKAIEHQAPFYAVLAFPPFGVSTAQVFQQYDPDSELNPKQIVMRTQHLIRALEIPNVDALRRLMFNDLEIPAFGLEPRLGELWQDLEDIAGQAVRLSGSGSTLFTIIEDPQEAQSLAELWQSQTGLTCKPCAFVI